MWTLKPSLLGEPTQGSGANRLPSLGVWTVSQCPHEGPGGTVARVSGADLPLKKAM